MKCFNKLLEDFVAAAAAGQLVAKTEEQRRILAVLAKEAAARGIVVDGFDDGFDRTDDKPADLCEICKQIRR